MYMLYFGFFVLMISHYTTYSYTFLNEIQKKNLWHAGGSLRLHLGCGVHRLPGYVNIDFPLSEHNIIQTVRADIFTDISTLELPADCVDEIRSHHLFEHFQRTDAFLLLCKWHCWLKEGATLLIETPDFEESVKLFLLPSTLYPAKQAILRHIFGSQEAAWAIHYDGWYEEKFRSVLTELGFEIINIEHTRWQSTANIIVTARKKIALTMDELMRRSKELLKLSLIDHSESEIRQWAYWCKSMHAGNRLTALP